MGNKRKSNKGGANSKAANKANPGEPVIQNLVAQGQAAMTSRAEAV